MIKVSVAIVTKNRFKELAHCLGSVLSGTRLPDEIVVIDNNSTDQTKQLLESYQKNTKVKIIYKKSALYGYPKIYNEALALVSFDWVVIIDDDCVASPTWLEELTKSMKSKPQPQAIMGWCETYYAENVFSQATLMFDNDWKERALSGDHVLDFEVLDNKNVAYYLPFLRQNKLKYDEQRVNYAAGASEDCDLGIQIQEAGGIAICNRRAVIWHKDPLDFLWLIKKTISSWTGYQSLNLKWSIDERQSLKSVPSTLSRLVNDFSILYKLSIWQKTKLYFVAKTVLILQKFLPIFNKMRHL